MSGRFQCRKPYCPSLVCPNSTTGVFPLPEQIRSSKIHLHYMVWVISECTVKALALFAVGW